MKVPFEIFQHFCGCLSLNGWTERLIAFCIPHVEIYQGSTFDERGQPPEHSELDPGAEASAYPRSRSCMQIAFSASELGRPKASRIVLPLKQSRDSAFSRLIYYE